MGNDITTKPDQLPAEWANKLAEYAKETATSETLPGNFFTSRSGTLMFGGSVIAGNKMEVCVLASMHENVFYPYAFDPDKPMSPACFAFSFTGKDMVPHPEAEDIQSETCVACPQFVWGSGENERGKACKEQRRLALLPAASLASPADVASGIVGLLRIPVTSVKHWATYATQLATAQVPPFAVVTEVSLHPDPKTQVRWQFKHIRNIADPAVLNALENRMHAEKVGMSSPYPRNRQKEEAAPAPAGKQRF